MAKSQKEKMFELPIVRANSDLSKMQKLKFLMAQFLLTILVVAVFGSAWWSEVVSMTGDLFSP